MSNLWKTTNTRRDELYQQQTELWTKFMSRPNAWLTEIDTAIESDNFDGVFLNLPAPSEVQPAPAYLCTPGRVFLTPSRPNTSIMLATAPLRTPTLDALRASVKKSRVPLSVLPVPSGENTPTNFTPYKAHPQKKDAPEASHPAAPQVKEATAVLVSAELKKRVPPTPISKRLRSRKAKVARSGDGPADVSQERDLKKKFAKQIQAKLLSSGSHSKPTVKRKIKRTLQVNPEVSPTVIEVPKIVDVVEMKDEVPSVEKTEECEKASEELGHENVSGSSCDPEVHEKRQSRSPKRRRESEEVSGEKEEVQPEPQPKKARLSSPTVSEAISQVDAEQMRRQKEEKERATRLQAEEKLRIAALQREKAQEIRRLQREQRDKEREEKRRDDEARKQMEVAIKKAELDISELVEETGIPFLLSPKTPEPKEARLFSNSSGDEMLESSDQLLSTSSPMAVEVPSTPPRTSSKTASQLPPPSESPFVIETHSDTSSFITFEAWKEPEDEEESLTMDFGNAGLSFLGEPRNLVLDLFDSSNEQILDNDFGNCSDEAKSEEDSDHDIVMASEEQLSVTTPVEKASKKESDSSVKPKASKLKAAAHPTNGKKPAATTNGKPGAGTAAQRQQRAEEIRQQKVQQMKEKQAEKARTYEQRLQKIDQKTKLKQGALAEKQSKSALKLMESKPATKPKPDAQASKPSKTQSKPTLTNTTPTTTLPTPSLLLTPPKKKETPKEVPKEVFGRITTPEQRFALNSPYLRRLNSCSPRTPHLQSSLKFSFSSSAFSSPSDKGEPCPLPVYNSDEEYSSFDSEDEEQVKKIPYWAKPEHLEYILRKQATIDPDEIFQSLPQTCELEEVFGRSRRHYARTNRDSGNWAADKVTTEEKLRYKKEMSWKK